MIGRQAMSSGQGKCPKCTPVFRAFSPDACAQVGKLLTPPVQRKERRGSRRLQQGRQVSGGSQLCYRPSPWSAEFGIPAPKGRSQCNGAASRIQFGRSHTTLVGLSLNTILLVVSKTAATYNAVGIDAACPRFKSSLRRPDEPWRNLRQLDTRQWPHLSGHCVRRGASPARSAGPGYSKGRVRRWRTSWRTLKDGMTIGKAMEQSPMTRKQIRPCFEFASRASTPLLSGADAGHASVVRNACPVRHLRELKPDQEAIDNQETTVENSSTQSMEPNETHIRLDVPPW